MTDKQTIGLSTPEDLLISTTDGLIKHIPVSVYREAPKIEWVGGPEDNADDNHLCFITENGYRPFNLYGPVLTKVLPWNLQTAKLPESLQHLELKSGYWLDLRKLRNETNRFSQALAGTPEPKPSPKLEPLDAWLPKEDIEQLKITPDANLYIVSWKENENSTGAYQINYLSSEVLQQCVSITQDNNQQVHSLVEDYFVNAGVQTGVLLPRVNSTQGSNGEPPLQDDLATNGQAQADFDAMPNYVICAVAVLNSFK